jgi:two-component system response regulator HydG
MGSSAVANDMITTRQPGGDFLPGVGFSVVVVEGVDAGRRVEIDAAQPRRVLVGKSPACELTLADAMVSRRHAALEFSGFRLGITDLESTNGTFVNEVAIQAALLSGGETIRVGATTMRVELRANPDAVLPNETTFGRLVGASPRMHVVFSLCHRLAAAEVPIVIEGETGTGKELLAECLHEASARFAGPFVVFDCAATARGATEPILFGERGQAGSGARAGVFELANGGTLFIDEIGELSMEAQGALLRATERGEIMRLGDDRWTRVNVRTIAASSRDLDKLVEAKRFREDLYFRLAVGRIELPPLRRRPTDILVLAEHFFRTLGGVSAVPADFYDRFQAYDWPGNVRELQNAVARFLALGPYAALAPARSRLGAPPTRAADLNEDAGRDPFAEVLDAELSFPQARQRILDAFERAYVERVLVVHKGNVASAAAASGIARRYFQLLRARQAR